MSNTTFNQNSPLDFDDYHDHFLKFVPRINTIINPEIELAKTIDQLKNISLPKGVLVTGIIREERVIIPSGGSVIEPGDRIIIFASNQAIPKLEKILPVKVD